MTMHICFLKKIKLKKFLFSSCAREFVVTKVIVNKTQNYSNVFLLQYAYTSRRNMNRTGKQKPTKISFLFDYWLVNKNYTSTTGRQKVVYRSLVSKKKNSFVLSLSFDTNNCKNVFSILTIPFPLYRSSTATISLSQTVAINTN